MSPRFVAGPRSPRGAHSPEPRAAPRRAARSNPTAADTGAQMGGPELAVSHRLAVPGRRGLREDAAAEDAGGADEDEGAEVYSLERGVRS